MGMILHAPIQYVANLNDGVLDQPSQRSKVESV